MTKKVIAILTIIIAVLLLVRIKKSQNDFSKAFEFISYEYQPELKHKIIDFKEKQELEGLTTEEEIILNNLINESLKIDVILKNPEDSKEDIIEQYNILNNLF